MSEITLKEFLEAKLHAIEKLREKDVAAFRDYVNNRSIALELQAKEYERRLESLNGEQSRIAKTQETYISREIWERFADEDRQWKTRAELALAGCMRSSEFAIYKETTDKALTLKAGQSQGFDMVKGALTFIAGVVVAIAALWAATKGLR